MNKEQADIHECHNCGSRIVIYKGWATFAEDTIDILSGAKWRCPHCEETGKVDIGGMN